MEVQHCATCGGEYMASAKSCAECGGPLSAGPPPELSGADDEEDGPERELHLDSLLVTLPGQQSHVVAAALGNAGVYSAQRCGSDELFNGPGLPDRGALARTKPVQVYVAAADVETAKEVLAQLQDGDQVRDPTEGELSDEELEQEALAAAEAHEVEDAADKADDARPSPSHAGDAEGETGNSSSSMTTVVIVLVAAMVVLGLVMGR